LKILDSLMGHIENKVNKRKLTNPNDPNKSNLETNSDNPRAIMMKNILGINFKKSSATDIEMQDMNQKSKNEKAEVEVYCGGSKISIKGGIMKLGSKVTIKYNDFVSLVLNVDDSFKKNLVKNFNIKRFKFFTGDKESNITAKLQTTTNSELDETTISERSNSVKTTIKEHPTATNKTEGEIIKTELSVKNEGFLRTVAIAKFFFITEYKPLSLFIRDFPFIMSKTNMLSLIIFKLFSALTICALLSETNSKEEKPKIIGSRDLAIAFITIFINDIPFTIFEILLSKIKVHPDAPSKLR
jgi:hypothetical protein